MNKTFLKGILLTIATLVGLANVQAGDSNSDFSIANLYPIDAGHSYVGFQVKYMGYAKVRGRFADFSGSVYYDPDDISKTSATVIIKTASIDTDLKWRDNDLKSANWFDAENYPAIKFQTTRVQKTDAGVTFLGELTMHGVSKKISLKLHDNSGVMHDTRGDSQVILTGSTRISRNDFGIKGERWSRIKEGIASVAAEVEIELTVLGKRINEENFRNWVRNAERPPGRIYKVVNESGLKAGLAEFDQMRGNPDGKVNSGALNTAGYMLLKEGRVTDAIAVFEHNISAFPDESSLYDSLGEAHATAGNLAKAAGNFRKALEKDPDNANAIEILRHLNE